MRKSLDPETKSYLISSIVLGLSAAIISFYYNRKQLSASKMPHWDMVDEASWESFPASDPPAANRFLP